MDKTERKITKIAREATKYTLAEMKADDVGTGELDFIHVVRHNPGVTQAQVRDMLKIDKGAAARRAASLEAKGYLVRMENPEDGRSRRLFSTDKAEKLKNSKASLESCFYGWLLEGIPEKEAATFLSVLDRLYEKSKTESRSGFPHIKSGKMKGADGNEA